MSEQQFAIGALLIAVAVFVGGFLVGGLAALSKHEDAAPDPDKAPQYWVGISVYEGGDHDAAAAAYELLKQQEHQLPGDREWMSGERHVRKFKVV